MVTSRFLIVLALCVTAMPLSAGTPWSMTCGGSSPEEQAFSLAETAGGDLIVAGKSESSPPYGGWLLRLDAAGNVLSQRGYGTADAQTPQTGTPAPDGGAVFAGRIIVDGFLMHHAWITRIDPDGNILWTTKFFTPPLNVGLGRYFLQELIWTSDGGVLGVGSMSIGDGDPPWGWIVKLDGNGVLQWQQKYRGDLSEDIAGVVETADGGYTIAGKRMPRLGDLEQVWVMHVDGSGVIQWQKQFGGGDADAAFAVVQLPDDGYAVAGYAGSFTSAAHAAWAIRLDVDGNVVWHAVFGESEWSEFRDVEVTSDGHLLFTGRFEEPAAPSHDIWAVKMRADDGTVLWQRAYSGELQDGGEAALQLADGDLLLGGYWAGGYDPGQMWLLRLDSTGQIPDCNRVRQTSAITQSPKPGTADATAVAAAPEASSTGQLMDGSDVSLSTQRQCDRAGCPDLMCDRILFDPGPTLCEGETHGFTIETTGGTPPLFVDWDYDGDTLPDTTGNPATLTMPPGAWNLEARVTDSCDNPEPWTCSLVTSARTRAAPAPVINALGPTEFCVDFGESVVLESDAGFVTYQWILDGVDIPGANGRQYETQASGEYTIRVSDNWGCVGTSDPIVVNADACPCDPLSCDAVQVDPGISVCDGIEQSFSLLTTGGRGAIEVTWDWDGDTVPDATGNPAPATLPVGDWTVTGFATDNCLDPVPQTCSAGQAVSVTALPVPTVQPGGPVAFCEARGETALLQSEPGFAAYQWTLDGADIPGADTRELEVSATGDYALRVTDANGCEGTSATVSVDAEYCPCEPLACNGITVDLDTVCEGTTQTFTASATGGEGSLAYEWDFDGDTVPDATGNPAQAALPEGVWGIAVTVSDSCTDPGVQTCEDQALVTVRSSTPPNEPSDVSRGAPPLLVLRGSDSVVVEGLAEATAYNLYADVLGSWYFPDQATGTICSIQTWEDNGDGTITIDAPLPGGAWFLVTASTACAESGAGPDSGGTERMSVGVWEACGAAP